MAERELAIVIRAKDLASRTIAGVNRQLGAIGSHAQRGMANAARNIERGVVIAGAAVVGGLVYATKAAGDFEAQMNTLNTIAMTTGNAFSGELGEIGDKIRKLARDTGTPLEDLTTAYYDLLSAGIKTADAQNVLTAANTLAIGGLATTAETIDLLTTAINSYGGDATKAALYADQFAVAIERGKVTAAEIAASFAQVGPLAAAMGVNIDEISGLLANMTARGTPAAEAFTQIRAAMIALQRQTPEMKRVLKELGITNVEAEVAARGLTPVYNDLAKKAEELGIPFIKLTGRVEGTMFALANTGDEFAAFEGHLEAVRKGTGTAQEQMAQRQQGLNFQMARMKAILNDVAITLGSKLIPKIVPLLEKLAQTIEANQDKIEQFADDAAAGFEKVVKWAMSLDWAAIGNSLKAAAGFAKGVVEAFLAMPSWVQQAVITGWGLNKLTGGAVGNIVGGIAGGLSRELGKWLLQKIGLMTVQAGVVNVNGGPGGGMPTGGGPGGGWIKNLAKGVALAAGAAVAFEVGGWLATGRAPWDRAPPKQVGGPFKETSGAGRGARSTEGPLEVLRGGALDKLATNEVIEGLARTTEIGLKGVGTSFQVGIQTGMDPLGDIATRILARAEDPKAPAVMAEIQGHLSGLEEIQAQYLANGDVHLAEKVQTNIDALHDLVGSSDASNAILERAQTAAATADANMIAAAERTRSEVASKGASQIAMQASALEAVRAQGGVLAQIRDKKTTAVFKATVSITNVISSVVMQQKLHQLRTDVGGGGFI